MRRPPLRRLACSLLALSAMLSLVAPTRGLAQAAAAVPASRADIESQGGAAYRSKHFKEAAALYGTAAALAADSERAGDDYNQACSLALAGDKAGALAALGHAVDDGWSDARQTASDSDLTSLHDDPTFTALVARLTLARQLEDKRWGNTAFKSAYAENLSAEDKVAGLSLLWAQAKYGFANFWHVPDLDWDATYKSYIPQVLATTSTEDYYKVVTRFYALLKDGHTNVGAPAEIETGALPFRTRRIDGKVLITEVIDPGFAMQGLNPGDEIVQIDGLPVQAYAEQNVLPYISASSPQDLDLRGYGSALLVGHPGQVLRLGVVTPSGTRSVHDFTVPKAVTSSRPGFEYRLLPGHVAYVALNEFGDDQDSVEWDKHWAELSQAKTIILDLRRNGGGDDGVGVHILMTLFDKPVPAPRQESPKWVATERAWGDSQGVVHYPDALIAPDPAHHFSGKVIMLTGAGTFSAAEDAVVLFATSQRGTIIGEATGGSTGQPLLFPLPGGGMARVCTKHDRFADGREFVGVGVTPDIKVSPTRADIVNGIDPVLEKAVAVARQ